MEMEKATLEEKTWSNTFKLQFEVKLELKRGNGSLVLFPFWRLTSSLRSNWRLNVEAWNGGPGGVEHV